MTRAILRRCGLAYEKGLKGCTTFRPHPATGQVIEPQTLASGSRHCCTIEREAD
jgi:ribonucleoside-diphosphate reductase alpha chain